MCNFIIEQFYKQRSDFEKSCAEREQKYPLPDGVKCTENIAYAADDKEHRLDVPQATLLAYELQKKGFPLRDGILSNEELVEELCQLKLKTFSVKFTNF